jgi:hypothetical protein
MWYLIPLANTGALCSFFLIPTDVPRFIKLLLPTATTTLALSLPYCVYIPYAELDVALRICAGYLAMKTMDIAVARHRDPPRLLARKGEDVVGVSDWPRDFFGRLRYACLLFQQTRYEDFTTSIIRPRPLVTRESNLLYYIATLTFFPLLAYVAPHPETKVFLVLLSIDTVFTLGHAILRPTSRTLLFDRPFLAPTLTDFWTRRWHDIIRSPLTSLAYAPAENFFKPLVPRGVARGAGLLAAFALSGAWHAWSVVPLGGNKLAFRVGMVFVGQGLGCILENVIWGRRETYLRRATAWAWGLGWAGWALRGWDNRADYGF